MFDTIPTQVVYNELRILSERLNSFMEGYPRRVGTMVMVSHESESIVEDYVNNMQQLVDELLREERLNDLDDESRSTLTETLASTNQYLEEQRQQIANARSFLAEYYG